MEYYKTDSDAAYEELKRVDPVCAEKLHPKNKRSVLRGLEVFYALGEAQSSLLNSSLKGSRFNACFLWVNCTDLDVLDRRLNERYDLTLY